VIVFAIILGMGSWAYVQSRRIGVLKQENTGFEKNLVVPGDRAISRISRRARSTALDARPIDWLGVVRELGSNEGGYGYLKTTRRLDEAFLSMGFEELLAALGEVASAPGLTENDRELLRRKILGAMFASHPRQALTRFVHRYREEGWGGRIAQAFSAWAKQSPDAAATWLEEQFSAGTFDEKLPNGHPALPTELVCEAVFTILTAAPASARRILSTIPENRRLGTLRSIRLGWLGKDDYAAWARLVRSNLPENDRITAISWPTSNWSDGDGAPMSLADVDEYFRMIRPDAVERDACILSVAGEPGSWRDSRDKSKSITESFDSLLDWVAGLNPDLVRPAAAKAFASAPSFLPYPEQVQLAIRCHQINGDDQIIIPLLEKDPARLHKKWARTLARELSDELLRETYLKKFEQ